jgi:hypothetical protein
VNHSAACALVLDEKHLQLSSIISSRIEETWCYSGIEPTGKVCALCIMVIRGVLIAAERSAHPLDSTDGRSYRPGGGVSKTLQSLEE